MYGGEFHWSNVFCGVGTVVYPLDVELLRLEFVRAGPGLVVVARAAVLKRRRARNPPELGVE